MSVVTPEETTVESWDRKERESVKRETRLVKWLMYLDEYSGRFHGNVPSPVLLNLSYGALGHSVYWL